jgi:hypothetical protein
MVSLKVSHGFSEDMYFQLDIVIIKTQISKITLKSLSVFYEKNIHIDYSIECFKLM